MFLDCITTKTCHAQKPKVIIDGKRTKVFEHEHKTESTAQLLLNNITGNGPMTSIYNLCSSKNNNFDIFPLVSHETGNNIYEYDNQVSTWEERDLCVPEQNLEYENEPSQHIHEFGSKTQYRSEKNINDSITAKQSQHAKADISNDERQLAMSNYAIVNDLTLIKEKTAVEVSTVASFKRFPLPL